MLGGQRKELDGKGDRLPIPLSLTRISRRYYKALFEKNDAVHDDISLGISPLSPAVLLALPYLLSALSGSTLSVKHSKTMKHLIQLCSMAKTAIGS